jgi:hypothetical protein
MTMTSVVWAAPAEVRDRLLDGRQVNVTLPDWLPQWWRCKCGLRFAPHAVADDRPMHHSDVLVKDGPLPVTVHLYDPMALLPHPNGGSMRGGAVTLRVTLDGHHADECYSRSDSDILAPLGEGKPATFCHPDAEPDCWHVTAVEVKPVEPDAVDRTGGWRSCSGDGCPDAGRGALGWLPHDHYVPAVWWRSDVTADRKVEA